MIKVVPRVPGSLLLRSRAEIPRVVSPPRHVSVEVGDTGVQVICQG